MNRKIYLYSVFAFSVFCMIISGAIVYAEGRHGRSGGDEFLTSTFYAMMGGRGMMGGGSMGGQ